MAFDGITIANIVHELNETILDGRINKIAQPEADELLLTIKMPRGQKRLYLSASASLPDVYKRQHIDSGIWKVRSSSQPEPPL